MDKLLKMIGYSNQLEAKNKFAYLGVGIGIIQLITFLIFFIMIVKSTLLIIETFSIVLLYLTILVCFKRKKYVVGKIMAILALTIQVTLLVCLWFPVETYFIFFFFIVPPLSFFVFDTEDLRERKILIILNTLAAVLVIVSVFIRPFELIKLQVHYIIMLRLMSTFSTIIIEILVFYFYASNLSRTNAELKILANTDALTNVSNRRVLFEQGERLVSVFTKYGKPFTLMILDIDYFKKVNDQYGHPAGDAVLKEMSKIILENVRKEDLVCRYGGEEFAILYRNMDQNHRQNIEKIKEKINANQFLVNATTSISITFSAGVVTCNSKVKDFDELVKKADGLLYKAKSTGRDRIIFDNTFADEN